MLRKTLVSLAVTGALNISAVHALELGELTAISKVDEPFKAEIQLLDVNSLKPEDITVQLGSESEFRQAEIVQNRILSQLRFQVKKNDNGGIVIDVMSLGPLDAKELDFVLSARWPSGKVVRKYNVPLTESAFIKDKDDEGKKVIKANTVVKAQDEAKAAAPKENTVEMVDPQAAFREKLNSMPTNGTKAVKQGDALWVVARSTRPKGQLTIYQTMMAIQALNEDAFYANNINLMREGAVLRLPTEEQIALFNAIMAKKEFDKQTQAWNDLRRTGQVAKTIESAQLNTQANAKPAAKLPVVEKDVLSLASGASPLPEDTSNSNATDAKTAAAVEELNNKLTAGEELLDKEKREKDALEGQMKELNDQLATLQELIKLKDSQLAELEKQLTAAKNAMQEQKNTVDQLLEADQRRRESELQESSSFINKFLNNPLYLSISSVLLMLVGILVGLLLRRGGKKNDEKSLLEGDDLSDFSMSEPAPADDTAAVLAAAATKEPVESDDVDDSFNFDFDDSDDDEVDDLDASLDKNVADDDFDDIDEDFDFDFDMDNGDDLEEDEGDIPTVPVVEESVETPAPEVELQQVDEEAPAASPVEVDDDLDELDIDLAGIEDSGLDIDDEDFVSNLLDDSDEQEDRDESALFDSDPSESLANSIEETLAETAEDDMSDMDVEFTAEEAAEGTEESDEEENIDFFDASGDEVATKLDLARAYVDMGDEEGARVILEDVLEIGNEEQIEEAQKMIGRMSPSE